MQQGHRASGCTRPIVADLGVDGFPYEGGEEEEGPVLLLLETEAEEGGARDPIRIEVLITM